MVRPLLSALAALLVALAAGPATAAQRVLVIFPFAVNGSVPDDTGVNIAAKIGAEITALGGVTVVRGTSTKPTEYRAEARAAGADLYYSGQIVPVGAGFSAIENLVTTRGGTVVWSTTMQFRTIDDVRGEGARIRDEVLRGATPAPVPART